MQNERVDWFSMERKVERRPREGWFGVSEVVKERKLMSNQVGEMKNIRMRSRNGRWKKGAGNFKT